MLKKIKEHEETFDENNIRDFIDLYIKVSREDKDDTGDTFTSILSFHIFLTCSPSEDLDQPAHS